MLYSYSFIVLLLISNLLYFRKDDSQRTEIPRKRWYIFRERSFQSNCKFGKLWRSWRTTWWESNHPLDILTLYPLSGKLWRSWRTNWLYGKRWPNGDKVKNSSTYTSSRSESWVTYKKFFCRKHRQRWNLDLAWDLYWQQYQHRRELSILSKRPNRQRCLSRSVDPLLPARIRAW